MAGELLLSWLIFSSTVMLLISASTRLCVGTLMSSQGKTTLVPAATSDVVPALFHVACTVHSITEATEPWVAQWVIGCKPCNL